MLLNVGQLQIIEMLERGGWSTSKATVLTVMVTKEYSRGLRQLVDILTGYPGLENGAETESVINVLLVDGWLTRSNEYGEEFIGRSPRARRRLEVELGLEQDASQIDDAITPKTRRVQSLGDMTRREVLRAMTVGIRGAHSVIRLSLLSTSTGLEVLPILKLRASQGVRVKVLLASPGVAVLLRGEAQRARAERSLAEWRSVEKEVKNLEVREAMIVSNAILSGSISFDDSNWQLAVYDPHTERAQHAEMLIFNSRAANVVDVFNEHFDRAWAESRGSSLVRRVSASFNSSKWSLLTVGTLTAVVIVPSWPYRDIIVGITAAAALAAVTEVREFGRRALKTIRGQV